MGNIATNSNQQLEKLKERGMVMDYPDAKVKEILLDIGYYRLGFYWNPFEVNDKHEFKEGTKFSDIVKLYYLDVDIRNILLRYIKRIEINFKTKLIYYVSNKYKDSPTWFNDSKVIERSFTDSLEEHYDEDFKSKNKPIKKHHKKYINDKYAPAWKTLEFFTFGTILKIFKSLNDVTIQERISNIYEIKNLGKFINLMNTIVFLRNTCAHSGVIFDLNLPKGISVVPGIEFNNNNRSSLDSSIKIVLFILDKISNGRRNDLEKQLDEYFEEHKENEALKEIIEEKTGYIYK